MITFLGGGTFKPSIGAMRVEVAGSPMVDAVKPEISIIPQSQAKLGKLQIGVEQYNGHYSPFLAPHLDMRMWPMLYMMATEHETRTTYVILNHMNMWQNTIPVSIQIYYKKRKT